MLPLRFSSGESKSIFSTQINFTHLSSSGKWGEDTSCHPASFDGISTACLAELPRGFRPRSTSQARQLTFLQQKQLMLLRRVSGALTLSLPLKCRNRAGRAAATRQRLIIVLSQHTQFPGSVFKSPG